MFDPHLPPPAVIVSPQPHILVTLVCDLILKLVFEVPSMHDKLSTLATQSASLYQQVQTLFDDVSAKLSPEDTENLTNYFASHHAQTQLFTLFRDAIQNVLADGKVDMNDAVHFITLVNRLVTLVNECDKNASQAIAISSDGVLLFLYFVLKAVLIFALDASEEKVALQLLQQAFQLVQLSVRPIDIQLSMPRCSCLPFMRCQKKV
jgi:hypothetical protein